MDAVNEASTVADDGLSIATYSTVESQEPLEDSLPLVSIIIPPTSVTTKIPLPIMSEETQIENAKLRKQVERLKEENKELKEENTKLENKVIATMEEANDKVIATMEEAYDKVIATMKEANDKVKKANEEANNEVIATMTEKMNDKNKFEAKIKSLRKQVDDLEAIVAEGGKDFTPRFCLGSNGGASPTGTDAFRSSSTGAVFGQNDSVQSGNIGSTDHGGAAAQATTSSPTGSSNSRISVPSTNAVQQNVSECYGKAVRGFGRVSANAYVGNYTGALRSCGDIPLDKSLFVVDDEQKSMSDLKEFWNKKCKEGRK